MHYQQNHFLTYRNPGFSQTCKPHHVKEQNELKVSIHTLAWEKKCSDWTPQFQTVK